MFQLNFRLTQVDQISMNKPNVEMLNMLVRVFIFYSIIQILLNEAMEEDEDEDEDKMLKRPDFRILFFNTN